MADDQPRYERYDSPAGGWGAAVATAKVLMRESAVTKGSKALLSMNQPGGFKCPSCAYPDPDRTQALEFCENGAKALAHEVTKFRVTRDFFERYTVRELAQQSDCWLEKQGRLTEPMHYDAATDRYVPIAWDDAFALIGRHLRALESPHQAEFYTSGRTPNEAAFLYAIFVRAFGTNNFPDCSNMCHEPTSRGLPHSIGVGKGTVTMADWVKAEAIFVIGLNTGTNSPRMMTDLVEVERRGVSIIAINPMPERALIRFTPPQDVIEMATFGSTRIASDYVPIRGHSNVQGNRTVGIDEQPAAAYLDRVRDVSGFDPPREHGHHTVDAVKAMRAGTAKLFVGMGGNFVRAVPDTERTYEAMRNLDLTVGISTKLNRGHVVHGKEALILPVISRSERIETEAGEQFVTIEDAMSKVTASRGVLDPASPDCLSEVEIVCHMARATLPDSTIKSIPVKIRLA